MATDRSTIPGSASAIPPTALALRPREAAKALGISERMLWSLTAPRGTIQSVRVGSCALYPVTELQAWLDRQAQATSEGGAA
ncbi:MAG: hypothetical protein GC172_07130 [Phycisphaera sp.]|nr:hypothetical protein [Phycisphaera sp.]